MRRQKLGLKMIGRWHLWRERLRVFGTNQTLGEEMGTEGKDVSKVIANILKETEVETRRFLLYLSAQPCSMPLVASCRRQQLLFFW